MRRAALEITLGQIDVQFTRHCWFALTGAACEATLDGCAGLVGLANGGGAKAGRRLVLKNPQHRIRSYLAVAGGIDVPIEVLGSRSTDLKVGIGGIEGRRLQDGDQVKIGKSSRRFSASRGVKQLPIGNIDRAAGAGVSRIRQRVAGVFLALAVEAESAEQPYGLPPAGQPLRAHNRPGNALSWPAARCGTGTA